MNNPDSSNNSEDKGVNVKDVGGNFTYTTVKGGHTVTTVSIGESIKTNNSLTIVRKTIGKGTKCVSDSLKKRISS